MRESCQSGSVRGAVSNHRPYRDHIAAALRLASPSSKVTTENTEGTEGTEAVFSVFSVPSVVQSPNSADTISISLKRHRLLPFTRGC